MYKAITYFVDLQDNEHEYFPGDTFPRDGYTADKKRVKELAGEHNLRREPLIADEKNILKKRKGSENA